MIRRIGTILIMVSTLMMMVSSTYALDTHEKGLKIAQEADLKDAGWGTVSMTLEMVLKNKHGQEAIRNMRSSLFEKKDDGDKTVMVFDNPRDVKGTASLIFSHKSGPDDQWLYLPTLKRVKRISSNTKSGPFMGSEFAYEDLSSQEVEKYTYKFIKEESYNGDLCYLIERYPVDKHSGYTRQQVWYNKSNFRIEKIDYYDRKNTTLKTLNYTNYKLFEANYWRPLTMKMVNHQNGKQTILKFSKYIFGVDITEGDFTPNRLKRTR